MAEKRQKKRLSGLLIAFFVLMGVTVLLCGAVLGLWLHGRDQMTEVAAVPQLPMLTPEQVESAPEATPTPESLMDEYTILYNGKTYRYKESMCNILAIGVDGDTKPAAAGTYGESVQSDVILLAAMDTESGALTIINVNRDAICEIEVLDENGESVGVANTQLALSYAYGDGLARSCELTRDAVSRLFYGLQIHGYGAYYMGGIAELNDAVGGVTVTVPTGRDYPFTHVDAGYNMAPGATVTLTGEQANMFIRWRLEDETGHTLRMARQKQYLMAFISQAKAKIMENPTYALDLLGAVGDYVVTDLTVDRISWLATQAAGMYLEPEIRSLEGELTLSEENHMELAVDQDALIEMILDVFYEEIV